MSHWLSCKKIKKKIVQVEVIIYFDLDSGNKHDKTANYYETMSASPRLSLLPGPLCKGDDDITYIIYNGTPTIVNIYIYSADHIN